MRYHKSVWLSVLAAGMLAGYLAGIGRPGLTRPAQAEPGEEQGQGIPPAPPQPSHQEKDGVAGSQPRRKPDALLPAVQFAEYMEPAIPRPEQEQEANQKRAALEKKFGRKPNILILLVDDLGYGDPGCYGGGEMVGSPTPHIDRLAREGLRLTSCYAQPSCTPTRAALMTGRLPYRSGLIRPMSGGEILKGNPWKDEVPAARLLGQAGYATALSGKWHLGEGPGMGPEEVGYDEWLGFYAVSAVYNPHQDGERFPELVHKPARVAAVKGRDFNRHLVTARKGEKPRNLKELTLDALADVDQDFAAYSEDFIRRAAGAKKPFYLVHAFSKVHFDNYPARGYRGKSPAATPYRDAVVEVDDIVGRLVRTLEETGQAANTLVFFTSDNGPEESTFPDSGYTPFRGCKATTWEGGVRVPGIAWWPGTIQAGRVSDGLFDLTDLFNTSLTLASVGRDRLSPARYIDGIDQTSFLLTDSGQSCRQTVFLWLRETLMALRWHEFKAHVNIVDIENSHVAGMGGWNHATLQRTTSFWLYSLYRDPKERNPQYIGAFTWTSPYVMHEFARHRATFDRYPPKSIGLEARR